MKWYETTQWLLVDVENEAFAVSVSPIVPPSKKGSWIVVGLHAANMPRSQDPTTLATALLDNHGHDLIGVFHVLDRAKAAAAKWMRQKRPPRKCACKAIT